MTTQAQEWQPPANWQKRPVVVLGAGVLGRRIAACFVAAGHHVRIRDPSEKSRSQALEYLRTDLSVYTTITGRDAGTYEALEDLPSSVKDAWLVFEAVPEILSLKENTFADLEKYAPSDAILATNSSSYKSRDLLGKVKEETKTRCLNTHFMMPPQAVIVELMTCGSTADGIFPFLVDRHKEAGLHPLVALKESSGFIFNRIWAAIKREVLSVLAEGVAAPETIDAMWIEQYVGRKQGPCSLMDSVGLDTVEHIEEHYIKERQLNASHLEWLQKNYIAQQRLGLKSDKGGLYAVPEPGSRVRILLLNVGIGEPLKGKSIDDIFHSGQILAFNADEPAARPVELLGKLPAPDGIDIALSNKRMYWTNMGVPVNNDGSIQSANMDGSDPQTVIPSGKIHTPKQLHVDQENNKLYFCDREGLRVWRSNLDGSELEIIYQTGDWETEPEKVARPANWPVGITVSNRLGKFFWTQKGGSKANEGRIFSAPLKMPSGTTPADRPDVETVASGLPECIDLEFDDEDGVLYWTDRGELPLGNTLNKKTIVGNPPAEEGKWGRAIIAQGIGEGIGLRLDKQNKCLYTADLNGHLWKCPIDGGQKEKLYEGATHAYTGLTFYRY